MKTVLVVAVVWVLLLVVFAPMLGRRLGRLSAVASTSGSLPVGRPAPGVVAAGMHVAATEPGVDGVAANPHPVRENLAGEVGVVQTPSVRRGSTFS